tara:strand:+ start:441 stop:674 length:234 start_codon:yes stop_codon:yes gene_type:complete
MSRWETEERFLNHLFWLGIGLVFFGLQGIFPLHDVQSYLVLFTGNLFIFYVAYKDHDTRLLAITFFMVIAQITRVAI